jgi:hypothetical protein
MYACEYYFCFLPKSLFDSQMLHFVQHDKSEKDYIVIVSPPVRYFF